MTQPRGSLYRRGADHGAVLGLYLSVMLLAMLSSPSAAPMGLVAFAMMACVPLLTYKMLRRSYTALGGTARFSELWMEGIATFACGSLIMAVVALCYMRWVDPGFIAGQLAELVKLYADNGDKEMAALLQRAIDTNTLPTASDVAFEIIWLGVFSGSMLSMLMSLLVKARKVKTPPAEG
jgi:hypothetical protein